MKLMPGREHDRDSYNRAPVAGIAPIAPLRARHNKGTQRERLLAAIVAVSYQHGYEDATIARVIAHAGVSRPSFYGHFANKQACFIAALADVEDDVLTAVHRSIEQQPQQLASATAITALVAFAQAHPERARFVMNEAIVAGGEALDARDRGIGKIARLIDDAYQRLSQLALVPALPSEILVGAI